MKILLVESNANELKQLSSALSTNNISFERVGNVKLALEVLSKQKFDLIVSTAKLIGATGLDLLKAIQKKRPQMTRILIDNSDDENTLHQASQIAHCTFDIATKQEEVLASIKAISQHHSSINQQSIAKAVSKVKSLPSPPKVYLQLNAILKSKHVDSDRIGEIIVQDPALLAKVLHFANSPIMSKGKPLNSISEAITRMGVDMLVSLVMTAELFCNQPDIPGFSIEDEQQHSLATAQLASTLVDPEFKQDAMIAGLLHDIGKLVLVEMDLALSKIFFEQANPNLDNLLLERKIFNCDHCHIGAFLLHSWGFPFPIIESVLNHHEPDKLHKNKFGLAQSVYVANKLLRSQPLDNSFIKHYKLENSLENLEKKAQKYMS